ncbi:MAG: hypothetical protein HN348_32500 [Proteobacteria bacterium]|nr:hypothetical protein [Pseudomonadota bacterium]
MEQFDVEGHYLQQTRANMDGVLRMANGNRGMAVAVPVVAIVVTVVGLWINGVSDSVAAIAVSVESHIDKDYHPAVGELIDSRMATERVWNEGKHDLSISSRAEINDRLTRMETMLEILVSAVPNPGRALEKASQ